MNFSFFPSSILSLSLLFRGRMSRLNLCCLFFKNISTWISHFIFQIKFSVCIAHNISKKNSFNAPHFTLTHYFQSLGRVLIFPLDVIKLTQSEIVNRCRNENSFLLFCDFYSFTKIPYSFTFFLWSERILSSLLVMADCVVKWWFLGVG